MAFLTTWTTITSAQTDADSPIDVVLMEAIRQDVIHLYEWIGQGYTPSTAHNHNGVNSANVILGTNAVGSSAIQASAVTSTKIGTTAVELGHLKLASGSHAPAGAGTFYLAVNRYAHWHRLQVLSAATGTDYVRAIPGMTATGKSTSTQYDYVQIDTDCAAGCVVNWDYHSS